LSESIDLSFPVLRSSLSELERAWRIAIGDLAGNVSFFKDGILTEPKPVILAGLEYDTPWTRDAAINVWNGLGLLWPTISRSTLQSVLVRKGKQLQIGGQYWDAIIWAQGAWAYYLYTGDRLFLRDAWEAVTRSLEALEADEFDSEYGLFRGPAVYGDGVAAYPDRYAAGSSSSILDWVKHNPAGMAAAGYGLPMMCLSTNCVYANAYQVANAIAEQLGIPPNRAFIECEDALRRQIQEHFWDAQRGRLRYLVDGQGGSDAQEGLGNAFALLFGLVDDGQAARIMTSVSLTPNGIACLWPSFPRYRRDDHYGRHSGTIWPFINAFWAEAVLRRGRGDLFAEELDHLVRNICRDGQCAEIYHPANGLPYGGLQEGGNGESGLEWRSCMRQSWSATGLLRMVFAGLLGMRFSADGIRFAPYLPDGYTDVEIRGLNYRESVLNIRVSGKGAVIREFRWKGTPTHAFLPASLRGEQNLEIILEDGG